MQISDSAIMIIDHPRWWSKLQTAGFENRSNLNIHANQPNQAFKRLSAQRRGHLIISRPRQTFPQAKFTVILVPAGAIVQLMHYIMHFFSFCQLLLIGYVMDKSSVRSVYVGQGLDPVAKKPKQLASSQQCRESANASILAKLEENVSINVDF